MRRKAFTLYLDPDVEEKLRTYCQITTRNRIRVINDSIREYVSMKIHEKFAEEGMLK